ncbi:MAG: hypothetical protein LUQ11_13460 [Methylococcaceae bacterium]|nr:hypothetical protein [Methylococcaceae bacterium]
MTYYMKDGFTTNQITGAIAAAALHDLHVNNFAFQGFPSVIAEEKGESFDVFIALGDHTVGPLSVPFQTGKAIAKAFQQKKQIDGEWFQKIQDLLVALEAVCSEHPRT